MLCVETGSFYHHYKRTSCVLCVETGKFYHNGKNKGGSFGPTTPGAVGEAAHYNRCKVCLIFKLLMLKIQRLLDQ